MDDDDSLKRDVRHTAGACLLVKRESSGTSALSVPMAILLSITELLAAPLGALVGGVLSAWVGSRQTAKVLKHETELEATERRETQRVDEDRRRSLAADQLIAALADFVTVNRDDQDRSASFVRVPATEDVHRERNSRVSALLQAGSSHTHALPEEFARAMGCADMDGPVQPVKTT